jgi:hypothetical protein
MAFDLNHIFTYHRPTEDQLPKYEMIRDAAKTFASVVLACTPAGEDQSVAIRHIRDAVMTANAAVALKGLLTKGETLLEALASKVYAHIERNDVRVVRIYLNMEEYMTLRSECSASFDAQHNGELLRAGIMGSLWNAQVFLSKEVPPGFACGFADDVDFPTLVITPELIRTKLVNLCDHGGVVSVGPHPDAVARKAAVLKAYAERVFAPHGSEDKKVEHIYMNAYEYADLRKYGRDVLDIESQAVILRKGIMGVFHGAQIHVSREVPRGQVAVFATGDVIPNQVSEMKFFTLMYPEEQGSAAV